MERTAILVIDDDAAIAQLFTDILEAEGYRVQCALSATEARSHLVPHHCGAYALVLTRPFPTWGADPGTWLTDLHRWTPAPLIVCDRWGNDVSCAASSPGVVGCLLEPFDVEELLALVAGVVA